MINQPNTGQIFEESIVDDDIVVIVEDCEEDIDYEWVVCMDYVQKKMICLITILIISTILLIFAYTIRN